MYQVYEALARERIRELHEAAAQVRTARAMASAQRWGWLARFAARRATSAENVVATASTYSLAG